MADSVRLLAWVLVEDAAFVVFAPVLRVHGVVADELELAEAVIAVIGACGAVYYEVLTCIWICELLRSFVGGEAVIYGAPEGCLFPRVGRDGDYLALGKVRRYGVGV
jgi:hypothetical protein